ncbi:hypothetical protein MASR2M66_17940 [Chloroflexota bacterium]
MAHDHLDLAEQYQKELVAAGLLIQTSVMGVYGRSGVFEEVLEAFDHFVRKQGQAQNPEVMRFSPVIGRADYLKTTHIESFPNLIGSIHSFYGKEKDHLEMLRKMLELEE